MACGPPSVAIMSGIVTNGPIPHIWVMLIAIAERRPMLRRKPSSAFVSGVAAVPTADGSRSRLNRASRVVSLMSSSCPRAGDRPSVPVSPPPARRPHPVVFTDQSSVCVQAERGRAENEAWQAMQPAPLTSPTQIVLGLEAIIDAAAGVLAEQSLTATLEGMARALGEIVPFTSLAIYEADHRARVLVPVFAVGRYVDQTLADRPPFDASIGGAVVRSPQPPPPPRARSLFPVSPAARSADQPPPARPPFDASIGGSVVRSREPAHVQLPDPNLSRYQIAGTPDDEPESLVVVPLIVADDVIGTL